MGTTGAPNIGGMYLAVLIVGAGMVIQLLSLLCSLLSLVKLVRRQPDLLEGQFYAVAALSFAAFAVVATVLLMWWAGAINLHTLPLLYAPSIAASLGVLLLWRVRCRQAGRRRHDGLSPGVSPPAP